VITVSFTSSRPIGNIGTEKAHFWLHPAEPRSCSWVLVSCVERLEMATGWRPRSHLLRRREVEAGQSPGQIRGQRRGQNAAQVVRLGSRYLLCTVPIAQTTTQMRPIPTTNGQR
jgi:hypothetical protein